MARRLKITNHDLAALGITDKELLKQIGRLAKVMINKNGEEKHTVLGQVQELWENPQTVGIDTNHPFAHLAAIVVEFKNTQPQEKQTQTYKLHSGIDYEVYGRDFIDFNTLNQMDIAMKLPITKAGALMPDAHVGYGLPIGGVLATDVNTIIPYAVGVDIACRMCLSVFDLPANTIEGQHGKLKNMLQENTVFGSGGETKTKHDETLFDREEWKAFSTLTRLKDKAWRQLGSSGTGNHFAEFGIIEVSEATEGFNIPKGEYLALLTHSGSRGFGASIANMYSRIAMQKTKLAKEAKSLAWLDMNSDEGKEYWLAMNLAGDYASANHHEIHNKIAKALHQRPIARVENHHNFAWKETLADGTEVMVHRKGSTPAGKGVLGIIPGSMTAPGYVVSGKGEANAINSASHGAGRVMSRSKAKENISRHQMQKKLTAHGIRLVGGDVDESPMVYKNIDHVMSAQTDLVDVLAKFTPKIVRMADSREPWED